MNPHFGDPRGFGRKALRREPAIHTLFSFLIGNADFRIPHSPGTES